jgi:hypothetical protein
MKVLISFMAGVMVCGVALFGINTVLPMRAESDNLSSLSENLSNGLSDLLPDIEKIYRESLALPFRKAESKIYDEDIAEFYHDLVSDTILKE